MRARQAEPAASCDAAEVWSEQGRSGTRFRSQSVVHSPAPSWELERQFILIYRDTTGLCCGIHHQQTAIRRPRTVKKLRRATSSLQTGIEWRSQPWIRPMSCLNVAAVASHGARHSDRFLKGAQDQTSIQWDRRSQVAFMRPDGGSTSAFHQVVHGNRWFRCLCQ